MPRRSWMLDGAIAAAFLVLTVAVATLAVPPAGDWPTAARIGTGVLAAIGLLLRRRHPLWLLGAAVLDGVAGGQASIALPFAAYAVTRYGPPGRIRWILLSAAGLVVLAPWQVTSETGALNNAIIVLLTLVLPAVLGLSVRTRAELITALRDRAERAEGEQQLRAREAVLAERTRITREMHDVVGHRVSLMVLQAGAVDMAAEDPVRVRQLAGQLQDAGRRSLEELRQLIGLLTETGDEAAPLAPQPDLATWTSWSTTPAGPASTSR